MSSWTLYFIYYKSFNTNINRFAGVLFRRMEVWKERLVCCKIQPQFLQYMNFIDNLPKRCCFLK